MLQKLLHFPGNNYISPELVCVPPACINIQVINEFFKHLWLFYLFFLFNLSLRFTPIKKLDIKALPSPSYLRWGEFPLWSCMSSFQRSVIWNFYFPFQKHEYHFKNFKLALKTDLYLLHSSEKVIKFCMLDVLSFSTELSLFFLES